jgi:hypothetical protein
LFPGRPGTLDASWCRCSRRGLGSGSIPGPWFRLAAERPDHSCCPTAERSAIVQNSRGASEVTRRQYAQISRRGCMDRRRPSHPVRDVILAQNAVPDQDDDYPCRQRQSVHSFPDVADLKPQARGRWHRDAALDHRTEPHPLVVDTGVARGFSRSGRLSGTTH